MSPISIPGKVTLQMQYSTVVSDPDATAYLQAVEAADGQTLEIGIAQAVNDFVVGCKADGTWSAIKASCILAGGRVAIIAIQIVISSVTLESRLAVVIPRDKIVVSRCCPL